jgi:hypothetical protein
MLPPYEMSLNRLERCDCCECSDRCNGRSNELYGYTRLRQPKETSTGHIWDQYREQLSGSLAQHRINTLGEHRVTTFADHCVNAIKGYRVNTRRGHRVNIVRGTWVNTLG